MVPPQRANPSKGPDQRRPPTRYTASQNGTSALRLLQRLERAFHPLGRGTAAGYFSSLDDFKSRAPLLCFFLARLVQQLTKNVERMTLGLAGLCLCVDEVLHSRYKLTLGPVESPRCVLHLPFFVFVHRSPGLIR